jgi:hypothetical protein
LHTSSEIKNVKSQQNSFGALFFDSKQLRVSSRWMESLGVCTLDKKALKAAKHGIIAGVVSVFHTHTALLGEMHDIKNYLIRLPAQAPTHPYIHYMHG